MEQTPALGACMIGAMDAPAFDCAICATGTLGDTRALALGYGVSIWLCAECASEPFQRLHEGRAFTEALVRVWAANGCLTAARMRALAAHRHALQRADGVRPRPGSYTWASLRREAERRFASGEQPRPAIDRLRELVAGSGANPPSVRTMMRWHAERRWLTTVDRRAGPGEPGAPSRGATKP